MQIGWPHSAPVTNLRSYARLETAMPVLAVAILFAPIGLLLAVGSVNRYAADDWCWPVYVQERGFFALQAHMYETSFGRWASTGLLTGVGYLGPWTASVLPGLGIGLWLASMTWFWREAFGKLLPALILSQLTVVGVILPAPEQAIDGVIWQTGLLTYVPPMIVASAGAAAAIRFRSPVIAALTAFLAAGFNESFMALEIAGVAAALVLANRQHRALILAALVAAVASSAIVFLSPGNDSRRESLDTLPQGLLPLGVLYRQIVLLIPATPLSLLFAGVAGMALSSQVQLPQRLSPLLIIGLALGLSYVALVPPIYGTNFLAGRTAMNVLLPLVVGAFLLGVHLGSSRELRLSAPALGVTTMALAVLAFSQFRQHYVSFDTYRQELAIQEARLASAAAGSGVVLEDPAVAPYDSLWQIRSDPTFLINRCIADYFGLASVRIP